MTVFPGSDCVEFNKSVRYPSRDESCPQNLFLGAPQISFIPQLQCKLHEGRGFCSLLSVLQFLRSGHLVPFTGCKKNKSLSSLASARPLLCSYSSTGTAVFIRPNASKSCHKNGSPCIGSDVSDGGGNRVPRISV